MLINKYSHIKYVKSGPYYMGSYFAVHFRIDADISVLFPYINSQVGDSIYYEKPHYIQFMLRGYRCILHPDEIAAGNFKLKKEALEFIPELIEFLNDIYKKREKIKPDYRQKRYIPVLDIYKLLPRTNCGECGYPTCMAFAAGVSRGDAVPDKCPALSNPIAERVVYPIYDSSGNLVSRIAIDIDSQKRKFDFDKQKENSKGKTGKPKKSTGRKNIAEKDISRYKLTGREIEVLRLMSEGLTNNEIAGLLSISPHTVKSHVIHIFNKIGVDDRTSASVWAARHRLI